MSEHRIPALALFVLIAFLLLEGLGDVCCRRPTVSMARLLGYRDRTDQLHFKAGANRRGSGTPWMRYSTECLSGSNSVTATPRKPDQSSITAYEARSSAKMGSRTPWMKSLLPRLHTSRRSKIA